MANQQRGEVTLTLCGNDYTLRPTFGALCELEERTGMSILNIISTMEGGNIRLRELALVIWAGMRGFDNNDTVTIDEVGELILKEGLVSVIEQENGAGVNAISTFLVNGVLGGEEADEDPKKQMPKSKKKTGKAS